jgi:hypothetical protein
MNQTCSALVISGPNAGGYNNNNTNLCTYFKTSDFFIYAKSGDRLDLLANDYYGDPRYWWIIANENDIGKGTIIPPVGIRLRIPYPLDMLELENLKKEAINGTSF